jgi:hypothetical protein
MASTLPVRLQELLGYNIHPPFIGYVDGRHPRKLLEETGPAPQSVTASRDDGPVTTAP